MEAEFNENDTTRTRLGIVIKEIRRQEAQQKKWQASLNTLWKWYKKVLAYSSAEIKRSDDLLKWLKNVLSFAHSEADKIRLED